MKKLYTYTIHLPDGTHAVTPPYKDLIQLRKGTMSLITSLVMDPVLRDKLKAKASSDIADLKDSNKEYVRANKASSKEERVNPLLGSGSMEHLKIPGKPLSSSYAYQKQWRESNPESHAASVLKTKIKRLNKELVKIKEDMFRLRGSASIEYTRLNKRKKFIEQELGLK